MASRVSIEIPGLGHGNPVPMASRIGPFLMSGKIVGKDPQTGKLPADLAGQCAHMFGHIRAIMQAADGSTDDIIKITVWLKNRADREALNKEWLSMFPDPSSRPARHAVADTDGGESLISCEIAAFILRHNETSKDDVKGGLEIYV